MQNTVNILTEVASQGFLAEAGIGEAAQHAPALSSMIAAMLARESESEVRKIQKDARLAQRHSLRGPPAERLLGLLRERLGMEGILAKLPQPDGLAEKRLARIRDRLGGMSSSERSKVLDAAVRDRLGQASASDRSLLEKMLAGLSASEENIMADHKFDIDSRGLPSSFQRAAWESAVESQLDGNLGLAKNDPANADMYAVIKGMLLLDQVFDPTASGFNDSLLKVWQEALRQTIDVNGDPVKNRVLYSKVADIMVQFQADPTLLFQQFAAVSRYVIANAGEVPFGHQNFASQVRIGMDQYVAGTPPFESLDLSISDDGDSVNEISGDNMRAFSAVFALYWLEEMRLFYTIERIVADHQSGTTPTGFDAAGRALDDWHFTRYLRMTEPERRSVYSRLLGVTGGEVPRDVQPNTHFMDIMNRFLGSVAELDRQSRISSLFLNPANGNSTRNMAITMENVRQAGHALAANMSLYAWGNPHFAARRINADASKALDMLRLQGVQTIFGVGSPYQVIERVCIADFGKAPDIPRLRRMAESGKAILDIVAKYPTVWLASSRVPLFPDPSIAINNGQPVSGISAADRDELFRQTQLYLAVNAIGDTQIDQYSKPVAEDYMSSIPALGGISPAASANGAAGAGLDKLKEMVSQGQTPSIAQLKQMLPGAFTA